MKYAVRGVTAVDLLAKFNVTLRSSYQQSEVMDVAIVIKV